ncbi:DUF1365 domain-containing protein [Kangiella japonica]|uniref:DUF1365 domain-containing protein n=1 Tax=Kangiella japonica TaxID=647384 RepID=A0ABN0SYB6_9GAMM
MLNNALVKGWVRHRRYKPKRHQFEYKMTWTLLDLDKVEQTFEQCRYWSIEKTNIVSFRQKDFHQDHASKSYRHPPPQVTMQNIIQSIGREKGKEFNGKVFMMSHLRNYGYNFNSVCFYFCYDLNNKLEYIVSEITNTPWGERHSYIFDCIEDDDSKRQSIMQFNFNKEFHVSPFIKMDMHYRWTFKVTQKKLRVHMVILTNEGKKYFDTTFTAELLPLTNKAMKQYAFRNALQPQKMSFLIYWQALKLWLKRFKVYDHPKHY